MQINPASITGILNKGENMNEDLFSVNFHEKNVDSDFEVVFLPENKNLSEIYSELDKKVDGIISNAVKNDKALDPKFGRTRTLTHFDNGKLKHISLLGIGKEDEIDQVNLEKLGAKIHHSAGCFKAQSIGINFNFKFAKMNEAEAASKVLLGMKLAAYRYDHYKTNLKDEDKPKLESVNALVPSEEKATEAMLETEALTSGIYLCSDLILSPPNDLYPETYANKLEDDLSHLGIGVNILGESEMRSLGMGALLGVGQGSSRESKLVVMEYYGAEDKDAKPVAFVGKGVTFDTGGISIKPSAGMADMKYDMGGSATVSGLMKTLAIRRAKINAVGVIGLVENMPGGNAQRPGDIVKTMSGKTAEVIDTDAEGRLVLSDALYYTYDKYKPEFMIDLATLTGAIVVALGASYAGLFSNNDDLSDKLSKSGEKSGELVWRMPLHKDYEDMIKSDVADVANLGNIARHAGSATAAEFLKHFIGDGTKWAHLDIAGMAWGKKSKGKNVKGSVGFGVKLLNQLLKDHYE